MNALKNISENLTLYAVVLYGLGYINLSNYYSKFGIDIIYYISLTDLLFYTISISIKLLIIVLFYTLFSDIIISLLISRLGREKKKTEAFYILGHFFTMLIVSLAGVVIGEGLYAIGFGILGFFLNVTFFTDGEEKEITENVIENETPKKNINIFYVVLIILIPINFSIGIKNADNLIDNIYYVEPPKIVDFNYQDKFYSTENSECYRFIGETSSNIFIYEVKRNNSLIINKSELVNFTSRKNTNFQCLKYKYLNFDRFVKVWIKENKNFFDD